jgi:hypothetical protein
MKNDEDLPVIPVCKKCEETLVWGDQLCSDCNAKVISGLPKIFDYSLGLLISVIAMFIAYLPAYILNMLWWKLNPIALLLLVIIGFAITYITDPSLLSCFPKAARLKLKHKKEKSNHYTDDEKPLNFKTSWEDWEKGENHIATRDFILNSFEDKEKARLLAYFPVNDSSVNMLIELSQNKSTKVLRAAVQSMIRLADKQFVERLREISKDDLVNPGVAKQAKEFVEKYEKELSETDF